MLLRQGCSSPHILLMVSKICVVQALSTCPVSLSIIVTLFLLLEALCLTYYYFFTFLDISQVHSHRRAFAIPFPSLVTLGRPSWATLLVPGPGLPIALQPFLPPKQGTLSVAIGVACCHWTRVCAPSCTQIS